MLKRQIHNITVGLIVEKRLIAKTKLTKLDENSMFAIEFKNKIVKKLQENEKTIPEGYDSGLQLWAVAFVQKIDHMLDDKQYWAELPYILSLLEGSGLFDINKDIRHD